MSRVALWGGLTWIGLIAAVASTAADQLLKLWLIFDYDLAARGRVALTPFVDLVLVWNTGISFSLFQQDGSLGQAVLLAVKVAAVVLLWLWLANTRTVLTAVALGLVIGGAVGNAIDRFAYGAVADFILFHISTRTWTFQWYVFNLADVAIVAGVIGLLYESVVGERAVKAP